VRGTLHVFAAFGDPVFVPFADPVFVPAGGPWAAREAAASDPAATRATSAFLI